MDPLTWTASAVAQTVIDQLLEPPLPGARLVEKPIHLSSWVVWRRGDKDVSERSVRKIVRGVTKLLIEEEPKFRGVSPDVVDHISKAATATLMSLDQITMDRVQVANLDPERLARNLEAATSCREYENQGQARSLYERTIIECCTQLVNYFTRRPEFLARTAVEQTRMIRKVLDHVEESARPYSDYESRYKLGVAALNEDVQLFGLGLRPSEQSYRLSAAYVSLSVQRTGGNGEHARDVSAAINENISFEDILASSSRVLLEGPAGAGKTTLLMRLALDICRGDLPQPLEAWNDSVPFLLRLRTFFSNGAMEFPTPDKFAKVTTPPVSPEPPGWTESLLDSGKAVVLIDGIDEIPETFRSEVMSWLNQLITYYPNARYLVTTRPAVLDEAQRYTLHRLNFAPARLSP